MNPTPYPDINYLLADLLSRIQATLGDKLVGLYLYGSLVWGDFDHAISDIDLLAALTSDLTNHEADALKSMHDDIARDYKAWDDRNRSAVPIPARPQELPDTINPDVRHQPRRAFPHHQGRP